ncbi:hypothetical protein ACRPK1_06340 [Lactobacillus johnsonii]|uniref:hypothetical protein n=1 Tax=Lactobacillus johnsonii TaxID=33959 RepID=UPI003D7822C0
MNNHLSYITSSQTTDTPSNCKTFLSIKDLLDITCFAVHNNTGAFAETKNYIYTLMRNIDDEIINESLLTHRAIRVRNLQQLTMMTNNIDIFKIILIGNPRSFNIPKWIIKRFSIKTTSDTIIFYPKAAKNVLSQYVSSDSLSK